MGNLVCQSDGAQDIRECDTQSVVNIKIPREASNPMDPILNVNGDVERQAKYCPPKVEVKGEKDTKDSARKSNARRNMYGAGKKSGRQSFRNVPPMDLYLTTLPEPIVGCSLHPIMANGDPGQRPLGVAWWRRRPDSKDETDWEKIGSGWEYTPSKGDLGYMLRVSFKKDNKDYRGDAKIEVLPPPSPPSRRQWRRPTMEKRRGDAKQLHSGSRGFETFKVLTWNVLSQEATKDWHKKVDRYKLGFSYRLRNLTEHIKQANADIICLQEIDFIFKETWGEAFPGYQMHYAGHQKGQRGYGSSCLYKKDKFNMVKMKVVDFEETLTRLVEEMSGNWVRQTASVDCEKLKARISKLKVRRKALIFELEPRTDKSLPTSPSDHLFVATLHVYRTESKQEPFIRLMQVHATLRALAKVTEGIESPKVILTGDLNSIPDSSIIEYLNTGKPPTHEEVKHCIVTRACKHSLNHPFHLISSYKEVLGSDTSYCRHSTTPTPPVEYILFTKQKDFRATAVMPIPQSERIRYPQVSVISSDHQVLITEFTTNRLVPKKIIDSQIENKQKCSGMSTPRGASRDKRNPFSHKKSESTGGARMMQSRRARFQQHQAHSTQRLNSPRATSKKAWGS